MRYRKSYLAAFFLSLMVITLASCQSDDEGDIAQATLVGVGDQMPAFTLKASDGSEITSSSLKGQIYLLNFFDTSCPDCKQELPVLQQVYEDYKGTITVLNVPRSQTTEEVSAYWKEAGLTMPVYTATDSKLYYKFATRGIPRTYLVNTSGKVEALFTDSPVADYATIDQALVKMLPEEMKNQVRVGMQFALPALESSNNGTSAQGESFISEVEIFFFDSHTKDLVKRFSDMTPIEVNTSALAGYESAYVLDSLLIPCGIYNVFVVANHPGLSKSITVQDSLLNIVDCETYKDGIISNIPTAGPVMTNRATSILNVDLSKYSGKTYTMKIELERVMAKIRLGVSQSAFTLKHNGVKYATVNITNYKFVNLSKCYYLFQHKNEMSILLENSVFNFPEDFSDYNEGGNEYIIDPQFFGKTGKLEDAESFKNKYASPYGAFTTENMASMPEPEKYGNAYILENTVFKDYQKNGYTPGVVFKAAVNPDSVYVYDQSLNMLVKQGQPEYWSGNIYLYNFEFYNDITALKYKTGMNLDPNLEYTDEELKAYGVKQCKYNMGVYETFYTYWIQHRTDLTAPMGPMKYGIVRNNYYRLRVTNVTGIGSSVIVPDILRNNYPNSYTDISVN